MEETTRQDKTTFCVLAATGILAGTSGGHGNRQGGELVFAEESESTASKLVPV